MIASKQFTNHVNLQKRANAVGLAQPVLKQFKPVKINNSKVHAGGNSPQNSIYAGK